MLDPQSPRPDWPTFFFTPDQLEAAMAHPDYSSCVPLRNRAYGIDGYLVTFGRPTLHRGAAILNERRRRYEATKDGANL